MDLGAIANSLVSSAIVGIFTLVLGLVLRRKKDNAAIAYTQPSQYAPPGWPAYPQPVQPIQPAQTVRPSVNFGQVLIHVAILQFVANVIGLFVGFSVGYIGTKTGTDSGTLVALNILILLMVGTVVLIIGFALIGVIVNPEVRWAHLTYVASGTAIATLLVNFAFGFRSASATLWVTAIITSFVQAFVAMGIGGSISMIFKRANAANRPAYSPAMAPMAQAYQQGQSTPYGYGGVPSAPGYHSAQPGAQQYPPAQPGMQQYPPMQPGTWQYPPGQAGNGPGPQPIPPHGAPPPPNPQGH